MTRSVIRLRRVFRSCLTPSKTPPTGYLFQNFCFFSAPPSCRFRHRRPCPCFRAVESLFQAFLEQFPLAANCHRSKRPPLKHPPNQGVSTGPIPQHHPRPRVHGLKLPAMIPPAIPAPPWSNNLKYRMHHRPSVPNRRSHPRLGLRPTPARTSLHPEIASLSPLPLALRQ